MRATSRGSCERAELQRSPFRLERNGSRGRRASKRQRRDGVPPARGGARLGLETARQARKDRAARGNARPPCARGAGGGVRLLSGSPFAEWEQTVTSVGWVTMAKAASEVTGWDLETIGACATAIGDLGEAVGLLLTETPPEGLSVLEVDTRLRGLSRERKAAGKQAAIAEMLRRSSPIERKYLVKTLSGGLRIGADITTIEEAIAQAFGADREEIARTRRDCG